jgi:hypothetical protein
LRTAVRAICVIGMLAGRIAMVIAGFAGLLPVFRKD